MNKKEEKYQEAIENFKKESVGLVQHLFETTKELQPMVAALMLVDNKPTHCILVGLERFFKDDASKELLKPALEEICKTHTIIALCIACEGWALKVSTDDPNVINEDGTYKEGFVRPTDSPNRVEVLNLIYETFDQYSNVMWEIERKDAAELVNKTDIEWSTKDHSKTVGKFSNLLHDGYKDFLESLGNELNKNGIQTNK